MPTDFLNIRENTEPEIPVLVVGSSGEIQLDIEAELKTEILALSENMFKVKILAAETNPEQYSIKFSANDQINEAANELEIVISEHQTGISKPLELKSPLLQMKEGINAEEVECKEGLVLMIKNITGKAACVTPQTSEKLVARDWGTIV